MQTHTATQMMATDPKKTEAFVGKVMGDMAGFFASLQAMIGDRLGLYKDLAARGPATSEELAKRLMLDERYVREWAHANRAAGYLVHDAATGRFALPAEHVPVLTQEAGPVFLGGVLEDFYGALPAVPLVLEHFRRGGGVTQDQYPAEFYEGIDRFTAGWFENLLLQQWIPTIDGLHERLQKGIRVADVGSGRGRALVKLATAYPKSTFVGYDQHGPSLEAARAAAREAGVDDRVTFVQRDVSMGLPERFDLVTTFDVVHDAVDPQGMVTAIRKALNPGGVYLNLDINCANDAHENQGPLATMFYGISLLYCMTTSLAHGGAALGTLGLTPALVEEMGMKAGFSTVRQVPIDNPFNNLYELRA